MVDILVIQKGPTNDTPVLYIQVLNQLKDKTKREKLMES